MAMRLFGPIGGLLFWAVAARITTTADVGLSSSMTAGSALLAGLAQCGLGYALVRYLPQSIHPNRLLNLTISVVLVLSIGVAVVFLVGLDLWSPALKVLHMTILGMILFVALVISASLSQLLNWIFLARRKPIYSLIKNVIQTIFGLVSLLLLSIWQSHYLVIFAAYLSGSLISIIVSILFLLSKTEPNFKFTLLLPRTLRTPFTSYALVNYAIDQLQRLPDTLMPLLILNIVGPTAGAYFFVAWSVTTGIFALAGSISPALFAEGTNQPEKVYEYAQKSLKIGLSFATGISLFVIVISPILLALYGPEYAANGTVLLIYLALSIIPGIVFPIYASVLRIQSRLSQLMSISILNIGLGMLFTYYGILWFGNPGGGLGWLVSRICLFIIVLIMWKLDQTRKHQTFGAAHSSA